LFTNETFNQLSKELRPVWTLGSIHISLLKKNVCPCTINLSFQRISNFNPEHFNEIDAEKGESGISRELFCYLYTLQKFSLFFCLNLPVPFGAHFCLCLCTLCVVKMDTVNPRCLHLGSEKLPVKSKLLTGNYYLTKKFVSHVICLFKCVYRGKTV